MAHEMKLDVVCEGVERPEQIQPLRALGADFVQGFLFGEPMPAADAQRFIAKNWKLELAPALHRQELEARACEAQGELIAAPPGTRAGRRKFRLLHTIALPR